MNDGQLAEEKSMWTLDWHPAYEMPTAPHVPVPSTCWHIPLLATYHLQPTGTGTY